MVTDLSASVLPTASNFCSQQPIGVAECDPGYGSFGSTCRRKKRHSVARVFKKWYIQARGFIEGFGVLDGIVEALKAFEDLEALEALKLSTS
jgi:hypothetical protein